MIENFMLKKIQNKNLCKYRFYIHAVKLSINKNIQFFTKIVWKRNDKKVQTKFSAHTNCQSFFDETLQMDFDLIYNQTQKKFQPKETQIIVIVFYEGNIKSGGSTKIDLSQIVSQNMRDEQKNFSLTKCPDPTANLQVKLNYQLLSLSSDEDNFKKQESQLTADSQILSIIKFNSDKNVQQNESLRRLKNKQLNDYSSSLNIKKSMSLFSRQLKQDFEIRQQKKSFLRINSLNIINDKIQNSQLQRQKSSLSKIIYQQNSFCHHQDQLKMNSINNMNNMNNIFNNQNQKQKQKNQHKCQGSSSVNQIQSLKKEIIQLQQKNQELKQTLIDLKIQHDKQNRAYQEIIEQLREELQQKNDLLQRSFHKLSECKTQVSYGNGLTQISELDTISIFAYRELYEKTLQELEQAKNKIQELQQLTTANQNKQLRESFGFKNFSIMDNISEIHQIGQFQTNNTKDYTIDEEIQIRQERIQNLQRQNTELQVQIASISHKIGQIFNAAFEFGGAKLLDHLQNSIGLTQDEER